MHIITRSFVAIAFMAIGCVYTVRAADLPDFEVQHLQPTEVGQVFAPVSTPVPCDILNKVSEARPLLEQLQLKVSKKSYRYSEQRTGYVKTRTEPEMDIGLALLHLERCELRIIVGRMRAGVLTVPEGYSIDLLTLPNGIRWNDWGSIYEVREPEGFIVLVNRVPRTAGSDRSPVTMATYSEELRTPEILAKGDAQELAFFEEAFARLASAGVMSRAEPGRLVADVWRPRIAWFTRIMRVEHTDYTNFLANPEWATDIFRVLVALNGEQTKSFTCSPAKACGILQFTSPTYVNIRKLFPLAKLPKVFVDGARDPLHSAVAAILLHDRNAEDLKVRFGADILSSPHLEELLASTYNTGPKRTKNVYARALKTNAADWILASSKIAYGSLVKETRQYITKIRYLRDHAAAQFALRAF